MRTSSPSAAHPPPTPSMPSRHQCRHPPAHRLGRPRHCLPTPRQAARPRATTHHPSVVYATVCRLTTTSRLRRRAEHRRCRQPTPPDRQCVSRAQFHHPSPPPARLRCLTLLLLRLLCHMSRRGQPSPNRLHHHLSHHHSRGSSRCSSCHSSSSSSSSSSSLSHRLRRQTPFPLSRRLVCAMSTQAA